MVLGSHKAPKERHDEVIVFGSDDERFVCTTFASSKCQLTTTSASESHSRTQMRSPQVEVIEIFSSDEDSDQVQKRGLRVDDDPFLERMPGSWPNETTGLSKGGLPKQTKARPRNNQSARTRRIIQSSSSEASESEMLLPCEKDQVSIVIDSSPERSFKNTSKGKGLVPSRPALNHLSHSAPEPTVPLYADDDEPWNVDDGSIMTLNEPKAARKPIRHKRATSKGVGSSKELIVPSTPKNSSFKDSGTEDGSMIYPPSAVPVSRPLVNGEYSSSTPVIPSTKTPRVTKKRQAAAEQALREQYAIDLFEELNRTVFKGGLPKETKLNWSKRLLTTAGRAKWHRSRDGVHTTEIELATKILDSDERIRNTLSHEMCHLACWVINGDPKEGHGKIWKGWAAKVERKRADIEVTTKHNYEISYPYEWECIQCAKIYGRFSKSIRPDECVCGACKVGKLVPLFAQKVSATPKRKAGSRMAPAQTQGSPCSIPRPGHSTIHHQEEMHISHPTPGGGHKVYPVDTDDSDSDLEVIAMKLSGVNLSADSAGL